ncbi:unnamed protein product [Meloidogyne enterolobii]|uniref:Uncharacterized protein n=1 Tax=Meloidogyne enterolobii TaxID=390850 RepID=A0ACB1AJS0_MELEN
MVVKGEPFLDSHYFLSEDKTGVGAQRRRKRSLESIQDRPEVAELIVDRPRRRVKRDYIEQPSIIGPLEETQSGRKRRQTTFFERRPVPKLPFSDPLYQDQWIWYFWVPLDRGPSTLYCELISVFLQNHFGPS